MSADCYRNIKKDMLDLSLEWVFLKWTERRACLLVSGVHKATKCEEAHCIWRYGL